jgi:hypothetical protein
MFRRLCWGQLLSKHLRSAVAGPSSISSLTPFVWANTKSKIYHFGGHRAYGNTKAGAYMCQNDTAAAGIRAAKNEKHP